MPWVGLQWVIVVFPGPTHYFFALKVCDFLSKIWIETDVQVLLILCIVLTVLAVSILKHTFV